MQVETLTGVTQIAAGHGHALALLGSGTVMAWGQGAEGELGNGAMELRVNTPVQVSGLANVKEIAAGDQESAALLTGGTVDAWGNNQSGQLGQGTSGTDSDVPLQVLSLSGAAGIAAGGSHMQAFGVSLPVVSSISPNAGGTGGGTSVTISGSDLGAVTEVKFGSVTAPSFTVNSANSITAVSPAGSGTVNVTVVTAGGTSPVVPAARFTYHSPPTVTKLSVKGGPASGGTTITLTGTNFGGTTEVLFGGVPGTEVKVSSEFVLTVTSPPNSSGTAEVRVRGAYGESPASTKARFKYAPVITSFSPPSGPVAGGNTVEITGAGFVPGTTTKFKFGKANSKSVTCASTTTCTALVPAQSKAGAVDVRVTANKGKSAIAPSDQYTYE